jgi:ATP-dependent exoDNAse (exonuclease V) beta subunit
MESNLNNTYSIPLVDGDTLFIDNSTLERFVTCPRSAGYYVGLRRELDKSRAALEFGKIIHEALAVRYARFPGYVSNECTAAMVAEIDRGFTKYTPDPDEFRNYGVAISAIQHYNSTYPMEEFEVVQVGGKPFVEQPFAVPLGEIVVNDELKVRNPTTNEITTRHVAVLKIIWKGRIDLVFTKEGRLYPMDHKTTSIMGPGFFSEFELSHQVHGYSWAVKKILGQLPSGFVINGLGIRKPTKTGRRSSS